MFVANHPPHYSLILQNLALTVKEETPTNPPGKSCPSAPPWVTLEGKQSKGIRAVADNAEHGQRALETAQVVFKPSSIHGTGGFARRFIAKEARVIEYVGERIDKRESLRRCEADNPFIFTLNQDTDLDGNVAWNPARFINHSCAPNCEAEVIEDHIWILAHRDIQAGEELTFNYGFDLEDYKNYPCSCGTPSCVGFIVAEEYFEHVRRQRALAREAAGERLEA